MKIVNGIALAAFLLSAVLQWNDPDPAVWMLLYAVAAAVCLRWHFGGLPIHWPLTVLAVCLIWLLVLVPEMSAINGWSDVGASFQMQSHSVEVIREAGGLALVGCWMCVLAMRRIR